jgi:hypothetical protein
VKTIEVLRDGGSRFMAVAVNLASLFRVKVFEIVFV